MSNKTKTQIAAEYKTFIADTGAVCWRCGRTARDRPAWWTAPFIIERCHLDGCNKPRKQDRRAVISQCSLCHRIQHGDRFTYDLTSGGRFPLCTQTPLTLEELLRLKLDRDEAYFDLAFLQSCSVRRLPDLETLK